MMHSAHTETHPPAVRDNPQTPPMRDFSLRRLQRRVLEALCAGVVVVTFSAPSVPKNHLHQPKCSRSQPLKSLFQPLLPLTQS